VHLISQRTKVFSTSAFQTLNDKLARKFSISLDKGNIRNMVIEEKETGISIEKNLVGKFVHLNKGFE